MSKPIVHTIQKDGTFVQLLGIKATILTQEETLTKAAAHIQAPLNRKEKAFLSRNLDLPLPVPVIPCDYDAATPKPKSVIEQLNDSHLGATDFRGTCKTCGQGAGKCSGKSAVHVLPWPVGIIPYAATLVTICKATCFACCRFLSSDYDALNHKPMMDFIDITEAVDNFGKYAGGRKATIDAEEATTRWNNFVELHGQATKKLYKIASNRGLNCIECQHCGVIQPNDICVKDKVVSASWDFNQTTFDATTGTPRLEFWKPTKVFRSRFASILMQTRTAPCNVDQRMEGGHCQQTVDAVDWIGSRLLNILSKQVSKMTNDERWITQVMPLVLNDENILNNTFGRVYTYANVRNVVSRMRHEDIWRLGKSPVNNHPKDSVWINEYIANRILTPAIQETSGGTVSANDPRLESYEQIIKRSAKLRAAVTEESKNGLDSWARLCKFSSVRELVKRCFVDDEVFYMYDYAGDVRMGFALDSTSFCKLYSNLQHDLSSTFDHTMENNMGAKSHNSAAKGVQNAKRQARMNKKLVNATGVAVAADDDDDEMASPRAKKKCKKAIAATGANVIDTVFAYDYMSIPLSHAPCPCTIDVNNLQDGVLHSYNCFEGRVGMTQSVQMEYWQEATMQVLKSWMNGIVVDRTYDAPTCFATTELVASVLTKRHVGDTLLLPVTEEDFMTVLRNMSSIPEMLAETTRLTECLNEYRRSRQPLLPGLTAIGDKAFIFAPRLPSPEQFNTAKFRGSAANSNANKKKRVNTENELGSKEGLYRGNISTKRTNFSARLVLVPDTSIPINCIGIPYRTCLSQTKPIIVTRANLRHIQLRCAKSRYWAHLNMLPDLGGVESVVTDEGIQICINNVLVPSEAAFDDEVFLIQSKSKNDLIKRAFASDQALIDAWAPPIAIGWTINLYLEEGDEVIISRPPILHRHNHNRLKLIPVAGFCMVMAVPAMNGYCADSDGDALMMATMQSLAARCSIRFLMPIESNMMCARRHAIICALQQDALLGACLLVSENHLFSLNKSQACMLMACFKQTQARFGHLGFKGRGESFIDPKSRYGPLWHMVIRNDAPVNRPLSLPEPRKFVDGKAEWTGLQFFEASLPSDLVYMKRLKACKISQIESMQFLKQYVQDGCQLSSKGAPEHLVLIYKGKWVCGPANSETLGTASDGLIELFWRHYSKYFACDWLSDMSVLAQTYLTDVRGFSCCIDDMIIGGKTNYSMALLPKHEQEESAVTTISAATQSLEEASIGSWPNPTKPGDVSKVSFLRAVEETRQDAFKQVDETFYKTNKYLDQNAHLLTHEDVGKAYAKLDEHVNAMVGYGASMYAAFNHQANLNNITLMAKTGSKGNSVNTSMISATLGVAKIKGPTSVGANILANTRNSTTNLYGEKTPSSYGFINRGFIHGLSSTQFFQTSQEARIRIKNCGDPSASGYMTTKIGVVSQGVSIRQDGTVRTQVDEIIETTYGGDGYDACKVKGVFIDAEMMRLARNCCGIAKDQIEALLSLVLAKYANRPENSFASAETLLARGLPLYLNVDVPGLFLLHSGQWQVNLTSKVSTKEVDEMFQDFCASLLAFDPRKTLMPYDLMLAVRCYLCPQISGLIEFASKENVILLLQDFYTTYVENMADPGEAVGPLACQSTNQPTTQLVMKSFKLDGGDAKQLTHISTGLSRVTEIFNYIDPKTAVASITLCPRWVKTEREAMFVASQFSAVTLNEWLVENTSYAEWISLGGTYQNNRYGQIAAEIAQDYINNGYVHRTDGSYTGPKYHEVCLFPLKSDLITLPGVSEFLALDILDDDQELDVESMVVKALDYCHETWKSCLLSTQMGGLVILPANGGEEGMNGSYDSFQAYFWLAFRHATKDVPSMTEEPKQAWMSSMTTLSSELPHSLIICGNEEIGPLLTWRKPEQKYDGRDFPIIEQCWQLQFKSKRLMPFLSNRSVLETLCYTSNLKEIKTCYGIEAGSQMLAVEASRILSSDGDVYVQRRHLHLLANIMTSEGDILPMNNRGLKKRTRNGFISRLFESISATLLKTGIEGKYDSLDHIGANIMVGQRDLFIGSGCNRILSPLLDELTSSKHNAPLDYESVNYPISECEFLNIVDFCASSGCR